MKLALTLLDYPCLPAAAASGAASRALNLVQALVHGGYSADKLSVQQKVQVYQVGKCGVAGTRPCCPASAARCRSGDHFGANYSIAIFC